MNLCKNISLKLKQDLWDVWIKEMKKPEEFMRISTKKYPGLLSKIFEILISEDNNSNSEEAWQKFFSWRHKIFKIWTQCRRQVSLAWVQWVQLDPKFRDQY